MSHASRRSRFAQAPPFVPPFPFAIDVSPGGYCWTHDAGMDGIWEEKIMIGRKLFYRTTAKVPACEFERDTPFASRSMLELAHKPVLMFRVHMQSVPV